MKGSAKINRRGRRAGAVGSASEPAPAATNRIAPPRAAIQDGPAAIPPRGFRRQALPGSPVEGEKSSQRTELAMELVSPG